MLATVQSVTTGNPVTMKLQLEGYDDLQKILEVLS